MKKNNIKALFYLLFISLFSNLTYAQVAYSIVSSDTRSINYLPQDRNSGVYFDFKNNSTDGLQDANTYHGVMTFRPYGYSTDFTGGLAHQLGFTDNGNMWLRSGLNTTWQNWTKLYSDKNLNRSDIDFNAQNIYTKGIRLYQPENPLFEVKSDNGKLQMAVASCNGCYASGAKIGDAVIRSFGNLIFSMPNNNNDGNSYIGINDEANGLWCKFSNNRTLRVNGMIYATEINVQSNVWADKVFKSGYKLKSLDEIEMFIKNNNHLPDVPSENDVIKNGINLAQMNIIFLQKIEELTLLMIEQNKTIDQIQNNVSKLKK